MSKSLIIHHNNVVDMAAFDAQIIFDLNGKIDTYIHTKIIPMIKNSEPDIIFIKDNLSSNYLELYGITLAYHIRLSKELEDRHFVPIVILSDVDACVLNKLDSNANILFTQNMYVIPNRIEQIEHFLNKDKVYAKKMDEKLFLSNISVKPPKETSHDIANEWAIYQWSHLLNVSSEAISKNTDKISSMLYFKYLVAKYHLETKTNSKIKPTQKSGKVLLIDDRWNDGWKDIMDSFIKQKYSDVTPVVLEDDFKNKTIDDVKTSLEKKIGETDPHIILLDLRLLENDKNVKIDQKKSINKLSGMQLIDAIKKINPGIQIIMFTASGDSLILDEIHNREILGYVKKDAPEDKYESSKNSFKKLDTLIKKGMEQKYLKTAWMIQYRTLQLSFLLNNSNPVIFELRKNIMSVFDVLNSNMPNSFEYAMLGIFKCIELLNDYFIEEKWENNKKYSFWKGTNNKIKTLDYDELKETKNGDYNLATENKIRAIIDDKTSLSNNLMNEQIKQIVCSRNYSMHPQEKDSCRNYLIREPKAEHIIEWFEMLFSIVKSFRNYTT